MVQFSTVVNASLEKVWEHLIYKIEKPENFVPGVSDVEIIEKIDPNTIGGFILKVGDVQIDKSVSRQLNDIKKQLTSKILN